MARCPPPRPRHRRDAAGAVPPDGNDMKVLVTGAGGFLGRSVVSRLVSAGHEVLALVRQSSQGLPPELKTGGVTVLTADLKRADWKALVPRPPEAVVSLAQSSRFRDFPAGAEDIYGVNVDAGARLVDWARACGVPRFILVSTGGVRTLDPWLLGAAQARTEPATPLEFYLATKLCMEILLRCFAPHFHSTVVLRPFFIYGPGQQPDMLIPRLIRSVRSGTPVRLQGAAGPRLNPIHVEEAASVIAAATSAEGHLTGDIGGPDTVTLREIAESIVS